MAAMRAGLTLVLVFFAAVVWAQRVADTMTGIFDEHVKSLQVNFADDFFASPIVVLGSNDRIVISFDYLGDERQYLRYSLEHCNASWQPSGLTDSEFLDGFNEGLIEDFDYSQATVVPYVHYRLAVPNEQVNPVISGNYLLKIYKEDAPENVLLQCRFMVTEATAPVSANVSTQTDIDYNKSHQQLSIAVDSERALVEDPFNDLIVVVGQNGRLDNETAFRQPLRMSGRTAIYEHQKPLIFEAGNEYRRFETVNEQYPGMRIDHIEFFEPYYHFVIAEDAPRDEETYLYDETQSGRYMIRRQGADDSDVEADYGVVHFTLDYPESSGTMIFLDGDFVQRRFDENSRMQYNYSTGRYERAMLLKQGSYNYQYLIVPPGERRGFTGAIEGDKYQTMNEYTVRVYHRRRGERYDRLIGTAVVRTDFK